MTRYLIATTIGLLAAAGSIAWGMSNARGAAAPGGSCCGDCPCESCPCCDGDDCTGACTDCPCCVTCCATGADKAACPPGCCESQKAPAAASEAQEQPAKGCCASGK